MHARSCGRGAPFSAAGGRQAQAAHCNYSRSQSDGCARWWQGTCNIGSNTHEPGFISVTQCLTRYATHVLARPAGNGTPLWAIPSLEQGVVDRELNVGTSWKGKGGCCSC